MPYLSAVPINTARPYARRLLNNPHAVHDLVMRGFPTDPFSERALWRWDTTNTHRPRLLILSRTRPDWSHIVERAGWPSADAGTAKTLNYQPLLDGITAGASYEFCLVANPVFNSQGTRNGSRTKPVVSTNRHMDRTWLLRKAEHNGFTVPDSAPPSSATGLEPATQPTSDFKIVNQRNITFRRPNTDKDARITLVTTTYVGKLTVTDPNQFRHSLLNGIGRAKAYGCGLLTIAPLA